ncbi:MAG: DinB family protein [Acidobacteria bacterium]|nr:MAG: DinB family protein [Acidobacteriota bacterium]
MHPQLGAIVTEFENGRVRLHRLVEVLPSERWTARPAPDRWSVAECVAHLNLTTRAFRPLVEQSLEQGRRLPRSQHSGSYSMGIMGGLLWWVLGRPGRFRTKTSAPFVPGPIESVAAVVEEFDRLQDEQIGWVRAAEGLPLGVLRVVSPFNSRVRYNLYAALSILARHQQRHLWQAEQTGQGN